jgi:hypothetical protein
MEDADDDHNSKFGKEVWEAAGSPMFGKLWSYDELLTTERPLGFRPRKQPGAHQDFKRPDNWPADTQVATGTWVFWLPEGWAQGIRTQAASGKTLMCYMNPAGKRFWHKKDIEKHLGKELPKVEKPVKEEDEDGKAIPRVRYVTDPDAIPPWPEEGLPRDWKVSYRQLPSGLHPIFIPPGKDEEGFLYQKALVSKWLSGELTKVSPFEGSKFNPAMSAGKKAAHEKKRKAEYQDSPATLDEFTMSVGLKMVKLEASANQQAHATTLGKALPETARAPDPASLAEESQGIYTVLRQRGFGQKHSHLDLIYVFVTPGSTDPEHPIVRALPGFYYRRSDKWEGKPMYQSIRLSKKAYAGVACGHAQFFWCPGCAGEGRWKVGELSPDDTFAGCLALSAGAEMSGDWLLAPLA